MPTINSGEVLAILNNHIGSISNIVVIGVFGPDWSDTGHFYTHVRDDYNNVNTHMISQIRYDDNNWHHYKLVIDNDDYTAKQYIDGSFDNSYDLPPNYYFDVNKTWRIGGNYYNRYMNISIDELKFNSNENLHAYYNFNEGSGTTVIDQTENGNDGIIYGGATYSTDVPILGCTNPNAPNYDETANVDDGSCTYPDNGDYSLSFDGVDDWVGIEGIDAFPQESGTIVLLYIGVSPNNQIQAFITDCLNSNGQRHGFGKSSDNQLYAGEYLGDTFLSDPIEWNEMQIYHIAYSWSAEGRKFYRDGDIIAETDIGSYQFYDDCGLILGRGYYSIYNNIPGGGALTITSTSTWYIIINTIITPTQNQTAIIIKLIAANICFSNYVTISIKFPSFS
jgi:hypothetical protein